VIGVSRPIPARQERNFMKNGSRRLPLAALLFLAAAPADALTYEVVVGDPGLYGQGENGFPFSTLPGYYGYPSTRYQQVFASSAFSGTFNIQELVFYASSNANAPILPGTLEIFLSVTDRGVNEISFRPFDDNLGASTRFFAALSGGFSLTGPELVIGGSPFLYDPAQGNLLLDIRFTGVPLGHAGPFFAALSPASVIGGTAMPFSRWHDFGIGFDDQGLVTGFRTYVPEPATFMLVGLGLAGLWLARRRSD
jgi:hypothetical protein